MNQPKAGFNFEPETYRERYNPIVIPAIAKAVNFKSKAQSG